MVVILSVKTKKDTGLCHDHARQWPLEPKERMEEEKKNISTYCITGRNGGGQAWRSEGRPPGRDRREVREGELMKVDKRGNIKERKKQERKTEGKQN